MDTPAEITMQNIENILRFLDIFRKEDIVFGEWKEEEPKNGVHYMPEVEYSDTVWDFVKALESNGWVKPFDWPSWQEEAFRYIDSPEVLRTATLQILQKLLTLHVRKERFCDGHLLDVLESGHIVAILNRLRELRDDSLSDGDKGVNHVT